MKLNNKLGELDEKKSYIFQTSDSLNATLF